MKLTFKTTSYYAKNKRVTKWQAAIFMLIGFVLLGGSLFGAYYLWSSTDQIFSWWNEVPYSDTIYDCDSVNSAATTLDQAKLMYDASILNYDSAKQRFYSSVGVEDKLEYHSKWVDEFNLVVDSFNEIISAYNLDPGYFENCVGDSLPAEIELKRKYIGGEDIEIDVQFQILKPMAETMGYVFYD